MAKRPQKKSEKELSRKQIAISRREREQHTRLYIGLAILGAVMLVVVLVGVYDQVIAQPGQPVAVVNGTKIPLNEYQDRVRYERYTLDQLLNNIQYQLNIIDPADQNNAFILQYYQQIATQISQQRANVDSGTLNDMIDDVLVQQKAAELGLSVTDQELNEAIADQMAGRQGAVTQPQATTIAQTVVAATATAEMWTPTSTPRPAIAAASVLTATATPAPALTESAEQPTAVPTPTRQILTEEETNQAYQSYLNSLKEATGVTEAQYREIVQAGLLREKVAKWFADQVPTEAEQVDLSRILAQSEAGAQTAMDLLAAGDSFNIVATEVSSDTRTAEEGGELGWYLRDELANTYGEEIANTAFSIDVGTYSQPISTTIGYQIMKVNERATHPLNQRQLQAEQRQVFLDWLEEARAGEGVQILWTPDMAPPDPTLDAARQSLPTTTQ